jgi:hypothetical protein
MVEEYAKQETSVKQVASTVTVIILGILIPRFPTE